MSARDWFTAPRAASSWALRARSTGLSRKKRFKFLPPSAGGRGLPSHDRFGSGPRSLSAAESCTRLATVPAGSASLRGDRHLTGGESRRISGRGGDRVQGGPGLLRGDPLVQVLPE